ncbi:MAG: protein TolR [Alphaproteobacteria bacterium]|jgi:biopolymer transport protein TolR
MAGGLIGRSTGNRRGRHRPLAEINVTPFVDVMLVLLIVFMVTAPLLTVGVPVELPKTAAAQLVDRDEPLIVTVDSEGRVFLQETERSLDALIATLNAIRAEKPDGTIYVRGDKEIAYGEVMQVMGALVKAGITKLSLVAETPNSGR